MTYQEFLEKLAETPRDWRIEEGAYIRRGDFGPMDRRMCSQCPITAVEGDRFTAWAYRDAAREIGLPSMLADDIAVAADNKYPANKRKYFAGTPDAVRADLLKACGLA